MKLHPSKIHGEKEHGCNLKTTKEHRFTGKQILECESRKASLNSELNAGQM